MTCIVAVSNGEKCWIGGDGAGVDGSSVEARSDAKVWRRGKFLMGFCGSFRIGQILQYNFEPPKNSKPVLPAHEYMCGPFVDELKQCLGLKSDVDGFTEDTSLLVCVGPQMFVVSSDYGVAKILNTYCAIGSGSSYALGSLATSAMSMGLTDFQRIQLSLDIVTEFCTEIREPFTIKENGNV